MICPDCKAEVCFECGYCDCKKTPAVIVDIDGTLANIDHRRHLVEKDKKEWEKFKQEIINDRPNQWCRILCCCISAPPIATYDPIHILFVTGREKKYKPITELQIKDWIDPDYYCLFTRKDNDFRQDTEIKREIYQEKIKDRYNIIFAIDDNAEIVELWRSLGIATLDCAGYKRNS